MGKFSGVGQAPDKADSANGRCTGADVVVLAGTVGHEAHWAQGLPRPLLPLPGTTIIRALMTRLYRAFDHAYTLCANGHTSLIRNHLADDQESQHNLSFFEDAIPRGPAGCLKSCEPFLRRENVFVANGSVWLEDDPSWMLEQHRAQGNALTVFCKQEPSLEGNRSAAVLAPTGLYCCRRTVLEHIHKIGYQDIKEQLVPALQRAGQRVGAVTLTKPAYEVSDWAAYMRVVSRCLLAGGPEMRGYRKLAPAVWCGKDVKIAPKARIVGPVLLDHGCRVDSGALVVGPTMLGNDCHVESDSCVIRVVAPDRIRFRRNHQITDRFLPSREWAPEALMGRLADRESTAQADCSWLSKTLAPGFAQMETLAGALRAMVTGLVPGARKRHGL